MNALAIRKAAGWSRAKVAVTAGCSEPTARLFEVSPDAVSDRPRSVPHGSKLQTGWARPYTVRNSRNAW